MQAAARLLKEVPSEREVARLWVRAVLPMVSQLLPNPFYLPCGGQLALCDCVNVRQLKWWMIAELCKAAPTLVLHPPCLQPNCCLLGCGTA